MHMQMQIHVAWVCHVYPPLQVAEAKVTEKKINEARESYRPAAARSSLLYFILNDLNKINPLYQFSLKVGKMRCAKEIGCREDGKGGGHNH